MGLTLVGILVIELIRAVRRVRRVGGWYPIVCLASFFVALVITILLFTLRDFTIAH